MVSAPVTAQASAPGPAVPAGASMEELLAALRAAAESTRLRLLVLCARGELTVSELAQILGHRPHAVGPAMTGLAGARHRPLARDAGGVSSQYRCSQACHQPSAARQHVPAALTRSQPRPGRDPPGIAVCRTAGRCDR